MMKVDQKKILILGGSKHMINAVKEAKWMGMSPIVVDNVIGSPAKSYADKAINISTSDIEGLMKIVRDEKVDGVFTAFEDINPWHAVALCKKMKLPFYATKEYSDSTSSKVKFNEICWDFDISVIEEKGLAINTPVTIWEFPVMYQTADR